MKTLAIHILLVLTAVATAQEPAIVSPIQVLIDRALPGDTIIVTEGTYVGGIDISKPLAVIGINRPVLQGSGNGSCITISASGCTVRGFTIERSGNNLMREDAGILVRSNGNRIEGNELRNILFGIYLLEADSNFIVRNTIIGRGHLDYGQRGSGIHIWNSHENNFEGNVIRDARDGFYIQYANRTRIDNNTVTNTRYGLHYMYADSNTFSYNRFSHNVAGAAIMYSRAIRFRHNVFSHNRGFASYGILFQDCHDVVADSNVIADNAVGMFFEASTVNVFRHNIIAQNDVALQIFQNSAGNLFAGNNFIDNLSPLTIVGKRTDTRWSADKSGNYWSSYAGYDLDGNGIGDIPMKIQNAFNYLEGRTPNLRLYLYSPASQALAVAASAFPIIDVNREVDEFPLVYPVDVGSMPALRMALEPEAQKPRPSFLTGAAVAAAIIGLAFVGVMQRRRK
ncbi:MAG: nitrous oxide reductase family maturation protein NosD [Bacteroidota bacterium]